MTVVTGSKRIYEGSRIPHPAPTILEVDPEKHSVEDILTVNFGPNHPSTHGVLRLIVDLDGEAVAGLLAVIGYLHTGFEKNMEAKSWWKSVTYPARIDYLSFHANELLYVLALEKLLGIRVPRRATWARMALAELNRIHSHLVWLGTSALEIGAISMFWYAFDDRDSMLAYLYPHGKCRAGRGRLEQLWCGDDYCSESGDPAPVLDGRRDELGRLRNSVLQLRLRRHVDRVKCHGIQLRYEFDKRSYL